MYIMVLQQDHLLHVSHITALLHYLHNT